MPQPQPAHQTTQPPPPTPSPPPLLQTRLHHLLTQRTHPKTLCPSEVARSFTAAEIQHLSTTSDPPLFPTHAPLTWRDLMPDIRTLCFALRDAGEIEILQRGEVVGGVDGAGGGGGDRGEGGEVRGPIRIRLRRGGRGGDGGGEGEESG